MNLRQIPKEQIQPSFKYKPDILLSQYLSEHNIKLEVPYLIIKLKDLKYFDFEANNCTFYEDIYDVDSADSDDENNLCDFGPLQCENCIFHYTNHEKLKEIIEDIPE